MQRWQPFSFLVFSIFVGAYFWFHGQPDLFGIRGLRVERLDEAKLHMATGWSDGSLSPSAHLSEISSPPQVPSNTLTSVKDSFTASPDVGNGDALKLQEFCHRNFTDSEWDQQSQSLFKKLKLEPVVENIHLQLATGEERRIQKLLNENDRWEYRLFTLDQEGLPERWETSSMGWSPEQQAQKWLAENSRVTSLQQTLVGEAQDGNVSVRLQTESGKIVQLEYTSPEVILNCQSLMCHCR